MLSIQTFALIVLLVISAVFVVLYFVSNQLRNLKKDIKGDEEAVLIEWLKEMKSSVERNTDNLDKQLKDQRQTLDMQLKHQREAMNEQTKLIWERLDNASEVIQGVQKHLGGLQEFGSDMKDLSNILKSPKLRGGLGEQFLYEILEASLPNELFKTQYKFKDGSVCDAIIKTDKGLIPIDSKFPMENFKAMLTKESQRERDAVKKVFVRDVKARINEISSKYILPDEGTTEFAVMYVPSENVYYELIVNTPEIEAHAKNKRVFLTSPNTLNYQLQAIFVAFQQSTLQKHAGDILKALSGIKNDAKKFDETLSVLERHIVHTYKAMTGVKSMFGKLFDKIENVQALGAKEQPPLLEDGDS